MADRVVLETVMPLVVRKEKGYGDYHIALCVRQGAFYVLKWDNFF